MSLTRFARSVRRPASTLVAQSTTAGPLALTRHVTSITVSRRQNFATISPVNSTHHRVVVVGGGTAGLSICHRLLRTGRFAPEDIAVIDPADWHHYQAGWTLVGGGLKTNKELRRPMADLIDPKIKFYNDRVLEFSPSDNRVKLGGSGNDLIYEHLVVAPGIHIDYSAIKGLPEALADPSSLVSSIYGYDTCEKVFGTIEKLNKGEAIFTQPTGVVKCAGAAQKIMWMALDHWKRTKRYHHAEPSPIRITFATGLNAMFGVPRYNETLEKLRRSRGVDALFMHDLVSVDGDKATFARPDGEKVTRRFDFLHVVPKMGPHEFVKESPLADAAGFVDVDQATTRHKRYPNVWSAGDASNLPTSKTTAAITSQMPILVQNLVMAMDGQEPSKVYNGYTSCPVVTDYGRVLLCEFGYDGVPTETFGSLPGFD